VIPAVAARSALLGARRSERAAQSGVPTLYASLKCVKYASWTGCVVPVSGASLTKISSDLRAAPPLRFCEPL